MVTDVNPVYTKKILGCDAEESDCILKFVFEHIAKRADIQCRVRYEADTVLVWIRVIRRLWTIRLGREDTHSG